MPYTYGQYVYSKNMLLQLGMEDDELIERYLNGLEKAYGTMWNGHVDDCITNIKEELKLKNFKWRIIDKSLNSNRFTATDLASYIFCPVSYSLNKSFLIQAPSNTQLTETGLLLHNRLGLITQINGIRQRDVRQTDWIDNHPFMELMLNSELLYSGHEENVQFFQNGNFRGSPDYIFRDSDGKIFVVEEKFMLKKPPINQNNNPVFYNNHKVQVVSYLKNINEYDIQYGYLIYWYYHAHNEPYIYDFSFVKILLTESMEKLYTKAITGVNFLQQRSEEEFDKSEINPIKCAACVVNKYCGHKTGKFNELSLPYNRKYMIRKFVPQLRYKLTRYLDEVFPRSDLTIEFGEIECNYCFTISTNRNEPKNAIDIFEYFFTATEGKIWILINEFDKYVSDYSINQFADKYNDCDSWTLEIEGFKMRKSFLMKFKNEINYVNLLKAPCDIEKDNRIYFIEPKQNVVFMYWDDSIMIGSNHAEVIKPIYDKYYDNINEFSRNKFEKQLIL
jgi:hypothetical protein